MKDGALVEGDEEDEEDEDEEDDAQAKRDGEKERLKESVQELTTKLEKSEGEVRALRIEVKDLKRREAEAQSAARNAEEGKANLERQVSSGRAVRPSTSLPAWSCRTRQSVRWHSVRWLNGG